MYFFFRWMYFSFCLDTKRKDTKRKKSSDDAPGLLRTDFSLSGRKRLRSSPTGADGVLSFWYLFLSDKRKKKYIYEKYTIKHLKTYTFYYIIV